MMIEIKFKESTYPNQKSLIESLVDLGYTRVYMVLEQGEFAVRGSIVDVFSYRHSHPVRLDYFGDELERLMSFDLGSQRSLSQLSETVFHASDGASTPFSHSGFIERDNDLVLNLEEGDYVVHESYGVGIYQGLMHLQLGSREGDYLYIQYKEGDKLYVPLEHMHLVHKFSEGEGSPKLNRLHDGSWRRIKARATRALDELVESIYLMVKKRQETAGFSCKEDSELQLQFEQGFPYTETPDQLNAIHDVKRDMELPYPMDRLLCGDVGFGKTEIMLRAAFKAFDNLKQVVILVPTTILAEQHYVQFVERFKGFQCRIATLSGFKTRAEQKKVLADLKSHKLDIVIGTHRLLQGDVQFSDLGLLLVDEEQRFGVTHKEKMKHLCHNVDILSVSATPIPRTMYMSLTGAKSFSLMKTAPEGRRSINTVVMEFKKEPIKEAIEHELSRNGQVYYVFNDIDRLSEKASFLKALLPELRIGVLHGRMRAVDIERTLTDFYAHQFDILLCTTIVENGLDIPNVNTIIMDKAESLGLSQIHQIRGRVGRSSIQGYAYIVFSSEGRLTENAEKRFRAIQSYVTLGAGSDLAMKDLEIRGAGSLLGEKQHGHVTSVGFELYCKLLEEAVSVKKGGGIPGRPSILLNPDIKAYIPESYVENPKERLALYRKCSACRSKGDVRLLYDEIQDRYGQLPDIVSRLFDAIRIQLPD